MVGAVSMMEQLVHHMKHGWVLGDALEPYVPSELWAPLGPSL